MPPVRAVWLAGATVLFRSSEQVLDAVCTYVRRRLWGSGRLLGSGRLSGSGRLWGRADAWLCRQPGRCGHGLCCASVRRLFQSWCHVRGGCRGAAVVLPGQLYLLATSRYATAVYTCTWVAMHVHGATAGERLVGSSARISLPATCLAAAVRPAPVASPLVRVRVVCSAAAGAACGGAGGCLFSTS